MVTESVISDIPYRPRLTYQQSISYISTDIIGPILWINQNPLKTSMVVADYLKP